MSGSTELGDRKLKHGKSPLRVGSEESTGGGGWGEERAWGKS